MIPNQEWAVMVWKEKVHDRASEIDPINLELWRSIALGFALGLGYPLAEAQEFVRVIHKEKLL